MDKEDIEKFIDTIKITKDDVAVIFRLGDENYMPDMQQMNSFFKDAQKALGDLDQKIIVVPYPTEVEVVKLCYTKKGVRK